MRIAAKHFRGNGVTSEFGAKGVHGFDIGVSEISQDGTVSTKLWRGNAENDENTAAWGTIWLVTEEMTVVGDSRISRLASPGGMLPTVRIKSNRIFVNHHAGSIEGAVLRLFDCTGRLLASKSVNRSRSIPLPDAPGAYFYEISGMGLHSANMILRLEDGGNGKG